jgi:hypothetical protein
MELGYVFAFDVNQFEIAYRWVDEQINSAAILALRARFAAFHDMRLKEPFAKGGNGWRFAMLCDVFCWVLTFGNVA